MARVSSFVLVLFLSAVSYTRSSCNYSSQACGSMPIPYPFGMSSSCGLPDFRIHCKPSSSTGVGSFPFLQIDTPATPELQVLNFSTGFIIVNSTDLKAMPSHDQCVDPDSVDPELKFELPNSGPFLLSDTNLFTAIGCLARGTCNASRRYTNSTATYWLTADFSCNSVCYTSYGLAFCNPFACCIVALPSSVYSLSYTGGGNCGYSTVLTPETFTPIPTLSGIYGKTGHYGLNISWGMPFTRAAPNCSTMNGTADYACANNSQCLYVDHIPGYACSCKEGYSGDGYKNGLGCEDIDECLSIDNKCEPPPLGRCTNTPGSYYCSCTNGVGNGLLGNCTESAAYGGSNKVMLVTVGVIAALVMLVLVLLVAGAQRARNVKRERKENFKRNGGEGLLQQMSTLSSQDSGRRRLQASLFTPEELQRATHNFSEENMLGSGGFGTVYKGELSRPHRIVAVKKAKNMQEEAVGQFINEILLLGQVDHPNIVQLLGCCLHTEVPLLVYEYVDNGTLSERLQEVREGTKSLSWALRLLIAVQSAEALAHLHSISPPILHRDIKSANILLDRTCTPKIAGFGASHFLPSGHTHLSVDMLVFTLGYLDPEYYLESKFTDKSDVYSFGVVLLELITALPAFSGAALVQRYFTSLQSGEPEDLMDRSIIAGGSKHVISSILRVADVATKCLATAGHQRPAMKQVCRELRNIESKFRAATRGTPEELETTNFGIEYATGEQLGERSYEESDKTSLCSSWEQVGERRHEEFHTTSLCSSCESQKRKELECSYPFNSRELNTSGGGVSSRSLELASHSSSTRLSMEDLGVPKLLG